MTIYHATSVDVCADFDYGEGWIDIQWPDPLFGSEGLRIDLDGHCRRNMPIRSGNGPPEFKALERDFLRLRFTPLLAKTLQLDEEIEIRFALSDSEYAELQKAVNYFKYDESA